MSRGPLDLVVVEFPDDLPGTLAPKIARLVDQGAIRIIDVAFVRKDAEGNVGSFELTEREGEAAYEAFDSTIQAVDGLIGEDDLAAIGAELSPGSTAGVLLWENLWAAELRSEVQAAGGRIALAERIPADVVEALETV
ncbi:DUF6325 family protein [Hamadaea sp. NPDC051192]|uniref:DUF6325 family protein n=1 Tax=Hamadaea sp. NPDC051192 TaxID=3154940 RepID=UPI00341D1EA1